jgi:hypothetical protein
MTQSMEQAIERASQLGEEEQDAIAAIILREIESACQWDQLFARPESAELLARMADDAMSEFKAGKTRKLDLEGL